MVNVNIRVQEGINVSSSWSWWDIYPIHNIYLSTCDIWFEVRDRWPWESDDADIRGPHGVWLRQLQTHPGGHQAREGEGDQPGQVSRVLHRSLATARINLILFHRWVSEKSRRKAALKELKELTKRGRMLDGLKFSLTVSRCLQRRRWRSRSPATTPWARSPPSCATSPGSAAGGQTPWWRSSSTATPATSRPPPAPTPTSRCPRTRRRATSRGCGSSG